MDALFFQKNRTRALQAIDDAQGVIVVSAYASVQRSGDAAARFTQESNFYWLSGIAEPGWVLIVEPETSWLIAPHVDDIHELFDGSLAHDDALRISGVEVVLNHNEGHDRLDALAASGVTAYSLGDDPRASHYDFVLNPAPVELWASLQRTFSKTVDCRKTIARLRAIKSQEEIAAIEAAVAVTKNGFEQVYASLSSITHEYGIEALLSRAFRETGAGGHAYEPIVAGGAAACTLHYIKNNARLPQNGLVLIDAGAVVDGYAADITRTYAVGTPTDREKAVHGAVEQAHREIVALIRPGLAVKEYGDRVDEIMKDALRSLELLETEDDYRRYFPHAVGHGLGLDVHDSMGGAEHFESGMVLTVEPGIYIPEEGIGVRLEDDILVTESGARNLSADLSLRL